VCLASNIETSDGRQRSLIYCSDKELAQMDPVHREVHQLRCRLDLVHIAVNGSNLLGVETDRIMARPLADMDLEQGGPVDCRQMRLAGKLNTGATTTYQLSSFSLLDRELQVVVLGRDL